MTLWADWHVKAEQCFDMTVGELQYSLANTCSRTIITLHVNRSTLIFTCTAEDTFYRTSSEPVFNILCRNRDVNVDDEFDAQFHQ